MKLAIPEEFKEGNIYISVDDNRVEEIKRQVDRSRSKIKCEDIKRLLIYEGILSPDQVSSHYVEYIRGDGFRITNGPYGNYWYLYEEEEEDQSSDPEPSQEAEDSSPIRRESPYGRFNSYAETIRIPVPVSEPLDVERNLEDSEL